jgi:hypothetical protein
MNTPVECQKMCKFQRYNIYLVLYCWSLTALVGVCVGGRVVKDLEVVQPAGLHGELISSLSNKIEIGQKR